MSSSTIFIVEDDPIYTELLSIVLAKNGFNKVRNFSSGEDSLKAIGEKPSIVLLDFSLGGLNGLDVLKIIREESPKTKVIMLTAVDDELVKEKCLQSGAAGFITKNSKDPEHLTKNLLPLIKKKGFFSIFS